MPLLIAFIAIPLIEIGLFVQIGGILGLWTTLAIVLLTAIIGASMVRSQGMTTLAQLQNSMSQGQDPTEHLVHGAMILFSGMLLLTPGFFTDAVGFSLLVPQIRQAVFAWGRRHFAAKMVVMGQSQGFQTHHGTQPHHSAQDSTIIDGQAQEVDPDDIDPKPGDSPSGWTRH
ncbi:MAG: FxsA family protein [Mangrovicoccus sp.]